MPVQAQRGGKGIRFTHLHLWHYKGVMWLVPHSWHITPRKDLAPIVREAWVGLWADVHRTKVLPLTGFNHRTIQLVVSDCIDHGTPGHILLSVFGNFAALYASFF